VIHRGVVATDVTQSADLAEVRVTSPDGEHTIRTRYVVGADGMHSKVRAATGIAYDGAPYAESFVLADVEMDWPSRDREVSLFFSAAGLVVVAPLPGGGYRIVATLDNAPEHPALADIQALLDARGLAAQPGKVSRVIWSSRFRVHHRLASSYRDGRLFLIGDAAHVHSPAGGQGMNCGLVDACVLGQLLAEVIHGKRPEAELDSYEQLRRPAAAEVLALAGRLTALATMRGAFRRTLRNAVFAILDRIAPVKRRLLMNLSGLSRRHLSQLPPRPEAAVRRPQSSDRWSCAPR
jgi:2-polyprenyl-6-methoxyphenol hydroxylase-like FAD-dependent oxidoreductase